MATEAQVKELVDAAAELIAWAHRESPFRSNETCPSCHLRNRHEYGCEIGRVEDVLREIGWSHR